MSTSIVSMPSEPELPKTGGRVTLETLLRLGVPLRAMALSNELDASLVRSVPSRHVVPACRQMTLQRQSNFFPLSRM